MRYFIVGNPPNIVIKNKSNMITLYLFRLKLTYMCRSIYIDLHICSHKMWQNHSIYAQNKSTIEYSLQAKEDVL